MINLYAVPFQRVHGTSEGMVYNIIDQERTIRAQYYISHFRYTLHDLLIKDESGAPNSMRIALEGFLNKVLGEDTWRIVTVFSKEHLRKSTALNQLTLHPQCQKLSYDGSDVIIEDPTENLNVSL